MSETKRRYIPPSQRGIGTPPDCAPYYDQQHLPLVKPAIGMPPGPGGPPPDQRQRFHVFDSIVAPAANTSNTLVVGYTVPDGHQAKVVGIHVGYVGTGFVEGDEALLFFSVRLNGTSFVENYAVIPNTLGSLTSGPWPIPAAIKLFAKDLIEILISVPAGSAIGTGGTNRMHGHLLGYYWPIT
jgi:hypothetical protein